MADYVWRDPNRMSRPIRTGALTLMYLTPSQAAGLTPTERAARTTQQRRTVEALGVLHQRQYHGPANAAALVAEARGWSKRGVA